jgi:hypothetical protein
MLVIGGNFKSRGGDFSFDDVIGFSSLAHDSFRGEGSDELAVAVEFGISSGGNEGSVRSIEGRRRC